MKAPKALARRQDRDTALVAGVGTLVLLSILYRLFGIGTGVIGMCSIASGTWARIYFGSASTLP